MSENFGKYFNFFDISTLKLDLDAGAESAASVLCYPDTAGASTSLIVISQWGTALI